MVLAELEKRSDEKCYWNPRSGNTYWLWNPLNRHFDRNPFPAQYFGSIDGVRVFFCGLDGKILQFTSLPNVPAVWVGDAGDDEPSSPAVDAVFACEVTNPAEKAYINSRLKAPARLGGLITRVL